MPNRFAISSQGKKGLYFIDCAILSCDACARHYGTESRAKLCSTTEACALQADLFTLPFDEYKMRRTCYCLYYQSYQLLFHSFCLTSANNIFEFLIFILECIMTQPPDLNLSGLSDRVTAAWAYLQKLREAVAQGSDLLENQSARLNLEAACHDEERRVINALMLTAESQCMVHQERLTYHFRLGNALDAIHDKLTEEEREVKREIEQLKADAREAQLQANLSNNLVADSLEAVSGLRVELWALQKELAKCNATINELHQRQWGLEDEVDAVSEEIENLKAVSSRRGLFENWSASPEEECLN